MVVTRKRGGACMAKTETQVVFRITNEFKGQLEAQAQRERRPVANMIRKVMEEYLEKQEKENE